jgi:hypothetical protein
MLESAKLEGKAMKRFISLLNIVLVLGLLVGGCAAPTPEVIVKEVPVEKKIVVTVTVEKEVVVEKEAEVTKIVEGPVEEGCAEGLARDIVLTQENLRELGEGWELRHSFSDSSFSMEDFEPGGAAYGLESSCGTIFVNGVRRAWVDSEMVLDPELGMVEVSKPGAEKAVVTLVLVSTIYAFDSEEHALDYFLKVKRDGLDGADFKDCTIGEVCLYTVAVKGNYREGARGYQSDDELWAEDESVYIVSEYEFDPGKLPLQFLLFQQDKSIASLMSFYQDMHASEPISEDEYSGIGFEQFQKFAELQENRISLFIGQ